MNKLREKFRYRLLGQLSDERTEVDVNNAVDVCRDFSISFSVFCARNYNYNGDKWWGKNEVVEVTTEELYNKFIEIYER